MAVIRIKNSTTAGSFPSGLTKGELAVNLTDKTLWVGASFDTDPAVYLSGVQTFNGLTGAVTGVTVGGANVFTQLNTFQAGISASGATLGRLIVNNGISAAGGITFNSLSHFTQGLSGSGATLGTLVVNNGISASGGVTFHNNVWVGGLLTANGGISAAGGVTFANTVYVGQTLQANANIYFGGDLYKNGEIVQTIVAVDTVDDLPESPANGEIIFVRGPEGTDDGFYFYNGFSSVWVKLSPQYNPNDINGDGIVDNVDLSFLLAAWSQTMMSSVTGGVSGPKFEVGIADGLTSSFEVKVYGITTGKKASAFRITSDDAVPQIYMKAGNVEMDSDLTIYPVGDYTTIIKQTGIIDTGYIHVKGLTSGGKGSTYDGNLAVGGLLTLNSGLSAGCGVTFNCLTHFTQGLSASGATLGTLVVNGGATFNGPVYMGATLTMNSNIRFNSGFGITGGFVDAGWY